MEIKLSTKGQIALAAAIRLKHGLQPGDSLDAKVQSGRGILTPHKTRASKATIFVDRLTSLPVLSAGVGALLLSSKQVRKILADFP
jgi:bifunctional DNA-binding transcriptional regulator/antitoxin component of YhaV-PrlF toxin-antitoxin module